MAQAGAINYPSLPSHTLFNAPSSMENYPSELSGTQLEAQSILTHILKQLREPNNKYGNRYKSWIERHAKLEEFLLRCVRPSVWSVLEGGRWTVDALKTVGGDLKFEGKAVYFDGVLGLDRRVRVYIGQAHSIRIRMFQHLNFRYRRDNPSLHYHALQNSSYNTFGILAALPFPSMGNHTLPGMDSPELLLNLLEMWMCLVFRTLPEQTLEEWLPESAKEKGLKSRFGGLNIASPLDQGEIKRQWVDLSGWDDPLVQDYLATDRKRSDVLYEDSKPKEEEERKKPKYAGKISKDVQKVEKPPQQLAFGLVAFGFILFIGIMLGKQGSRPTPKPLGRPRWR